MPRTVSVSCPVLLGLLLFTAGTFPAAAGVVLTYAQLDPDADAPRTIVVEAEGDGLRVESEGEVVVFRADRGVLWRIDPLQETHETFGADDLRRIAAALEAERSRLAGVVPGLLPGGEADALARVADAWGGLAAVDDLEARPTGEAGVIGSFLATQYVVTAANQEVATVWTAHPDSVGVPQSALDVADRLAELLGPAPWTPMLGRYLRDPRRDPPAGVPPGLPVLVVERLGDRAGQRTELVSLREEAVAASRFTLPEGSREVRRPIEF
jgi:hypothetical protein